MNIKNTLKLVFLAVVGFAILVYFTAPNKPKPQDTKTNSDLTYTTIPNYVQITGVDNYVKKSDYINKDKPSYIIVLNHDALAVFNKLEEYTSKNILFVANISSTPWLIKKLAVDGELEKLYLDSKYKIINDSSGDFVKSLKLNDTRQNSYNIYKLTKEGKIVKLISGTVKKNALQEGIEKEEKEAVLLDVVGKLNRL
ncbi:MAG: hypothetical protein ACQERD_03630 [Campylobacterota bacterium]